MSILKWTSPIRQGGLSPIPNEVYMEIFSYLRPPDSKPWIDPVYRRCFSRIALVCRFFCSVMLSWIFETIEFACKNSNGSSLNHAPFCRSIIRGCRSARAMATHVKVCSFSDWISDQNDPPSHWCNMEFQTLYSRALAFMPNIEELKLTKIYLDKPLLKSIMGFKRLTSLSLDLCLIKVKEKDVCKLSMLRLKTLRLFGGPGPSRILVDDDTLLICQSICLNSLLKVYTNCWSFVTRIASQSGHLPLQELDIVEAHDIQLLPKIFRKTPALKILRISSAEPSPHEMKFDDTLPVLDELCCPLFLLRSLLPGRPISIIKIPSNSLAEITDIQSLFKKSTSRIRSLCVPVQVYRSIPFWEHFPDLTSLRLDGPRQQKLLPFTEQSLQEYLSDISDSWPHNPPIQELHLSLDCGHMDPFFDLELQNRIISTTISPRFPHLRCMSISDYLVWNKVQGDDIWKPSLHRIPLLGVAKQLRRVNPVDYDGFLEEILLTVEEFW